MGVYAALEAGEGNVVMTDVDPGAVAAAARNAIRNGVGGARTVVSDGFSALDETGFDLILSNPPYHADFSVAKHFIEKGFNRLKIGGGMLMVTKRRDWYQNKFAAIFGGAKVHAIDGYFRVRGAAARFPIRERKEISDVFCLARAARLAGAPFFYRRRAEGKANAHQRAGCVDQHVGRRRAAPADPYLVNFVAGRVGAGDEKRREKPRSAPICAACPVKAPTRPKIPISYRP